MVNKMKKGEEMKIIFEARYFRNDDEWDYFLKQLQIPKEKRDDIIEVELDVFNAEATTISGDKITL